MMQLLKTGFALLLVLSLGSMATAELRFANIFNDHMVLQQEKPLAIWGWADPGATVTVTLTEKDAVAIKAVGDEALQRPTTELPDDAKSTPEPAVRIEYFQENMPDFKTITASATANAEGRWKVELPPLTASFIPKYLCVASGNDKVALLDVLVGEVWVTAGQSNMAYSGDKTGWLNKQGMLLPGVRYAHTGKNSSYKPQSDLAQRSQWIPCTGKQVASFSTVPYLFGKYLHRQLQVPVGIVNAASGGAFGNYWSSPENLAAIDFWEMKQMRERENAVIAEWKNETSRKKIIDAYEKSYKELKAQWEKESAQAKAKKKRPPKEPQYKPPTGPKLPHKLSCLYNGRIAPISPMTIRGALYLQGEQQVLAWGNSRYEWVFPAVVKSFQEAFSQKELPLGIITLQGAGHNKMPITELGPSNRTAAIRDIHFRTHQANPGSGFICAHDVGRGLHPSWKRPLAERAVHWALRSVYKTTADKSCSPGKIVFEKNRVMVQINEKASRMKRVGREQVREEFLRPMRIATYSGNDSQYLGGFMVAGADQRWYPAKVRPATKEEEGMSLVVWSDLVPEPVALRYGWGSYPVANIGPWENPLPPFRTDDWPLPEGTNLDPEKQQKARSDWYGMLHGGYEDMQDRTIRQGQFEAARSEMLLYGKVKKILQSKADRIDRILKETAPGYYSQAGLFHIDATDWTIRRANEKYLADAADVPEQMENLSKNAMLQEKIKKLREALKEYRQAVQSLEDEK